MAARFEITELHSDALGMTVIQLADREFGSVARVAPEKGGNLYSLVVPVDGVGAEVMLPPDPADPRNMRIGTPILFPWPNRIRGGRFSFDGREYQLDVNADGVAIHGLVTSRRFDVTRAEATPDGAIVATEILSERHPEILRMFPFPFRLSEAFTLVGDTIRMDTVATNLGNTRMPMGYGIHPWFRLPIFGDGPRAGDRRKCILQVPSSTQWELVRPLVPTGRLIKPLEGHDFSSASPLGDVFLDDVYTSLAGSDGIKTCTYSDPAAGLSIVVRADSSFREMVIYAPSSPGAICIEPYTCVTDAFNIQAQGRDAGLIVLEPGESWKGTIWLTARVD